MAVLELGVSIVLPKMQSNPVNMDYLWWRAMAVN